MSFSDYISNMLAPFICFHIHLYHPHSIYHDFHLTYCISLLFVSLFLLLSSGLVNCPFVLWCHVQLCASENWISQRPCRLASGQTWPKKELVEDRFLWCLLITSSLCLQLPPDRPVFCRPNSAGSPHQVNVGWTTLCLDAALSTSSLRSFSPRISRDYGESQTASSWCLNS